MKMPASAPPRPDWNEPSRLTTLPCRSSSAVRSPKYQTVPRLVCAYQSVVRSRRIPSSNRRSRTTRQVTPSMTRVRWLT